jgi:5-methylcytosine-specific restriction protein B
MTLDIKVAQDIKTIYEQLKDEGEVLNKSQLSVYYDAFRQRFGPDKLKNLDGEELLSTMHEHSNRDSLVYWLEFKDDNEFPANFGSIAGGSALKFGIYKRKETGIWMTGSPQAQIEISIEAAILRAREHRDQLIKAAELLDGLPQMGSDEDYRKLQQEIDKAAPRVSDTAWGHKYLSLLHPDKLDDYHNADYQRFHLIMLLQAPPPGAGRYIAAGRYVAIAGEMDMPINHLTTITNRRDGDPHRYWRVGTSDSAKPRNHWAEMRDGSYISIGWTNLGDLSEVTRNEESKQKIRSLVEKFYPNTPPAVGHATNETFNFVAVMAENDVILAADGNTIIGIGKIRGGYQYDGTKQFCHIRPVEWLSFEEWALPISEGLRTTVNTIRKDTNLIETEKRILYAAPIIPEKPAVLAPLEGTLWRIQSILERKGQVIIYGPPGTGKTYWAEKAAKELSSRSKYKKSFEQLDGEQQKTIIGPSDETGSYVRMCCFHPAYGYEDFLEGYRPDSSGGSMVFTLKDGIFKQTCSDATADPQHNYYLIIDEINRGDIPRIFGELLTVLEKDKRGKPIALPLSGQAFEVPRNVYIIGTMNTADRSIALLDTALRRRFGFIELMPDVSLLAGASLEGIPLGPWLRELNKRICEHIGRDSRNRQIGHSYLMDGGKPFTSFQKFVKGLREDIIPLLQEYCYEDYSALEKILGSGMVNLEIQQIRNELFNEPNQTQLIQALLAPSPEISTSPQATSTEEKPAAEGEEEETLEETKQ